MVSVAVLMQLPDLPMYIYYHSHHQLLLLLLVLLLVLLVTRHLQDTDPSSCS